MVNKKGVICLFLALITVFSLASCGEEKKPEYFTESYNTSAGVLTVYAAYANGEDDAFTDEALAKAAKNSADSFETAYEYVAKNATLDFINRESDVILDCDESYLSLVENIFALSEKTNGRFTPAHGAYTAAVKAEDKTDESVSASLKHCGIDKFTFDKTTVRKSDKSAKIDLAAYAAGYALDEALKTVKESGVKSGRISLGNIEAVFGSKPDGDAYNVGVKTGFFRITDGCVSYVDGSRENPNYTENEGEFSSVSVFAPDAVTADTVALAVYNMTVDEAKALYDGKAFSFEAVMVTKDGKTVMTDRAGNGLYMEETTAEEKNG